MWFRWIWRLLLVQVAQGCNAAATSRFFSSFRLHPRRRRGRLAFPRNSTVFLCLCGVFSSRSCVRHAVTSARAVCACAGGYGATCLHKLQHRWKKQQRTKRKNKKEEHSKGRKPSTCVRVCDLVRNSSLIQAPTHIHGHSSSNTDACSSAHVSCVCCCVPPFAASTFSGVLSRDVVAARGAPLFFPFLLPCVSSSVGAPLALARMRPLPLPRLWAPAWMARMFFGQALPPPTLPRTPRPISSPLFVQIPRQLWHSFLPRRGRRTPISTMQRYSHKKRRKGAMSATAHARPR